jgi:wobble nucleotide-excising tRNase
MLEKFISIKNVGRFRDCHSQGDVSFRKLTLLFAENGQGKTTLCAILRSLQSGQHEFISERKTLGENNPSYVQVRLAGNTISFTDNKWSDTHPDIAIFDSVFVHDNVYAGDYVDHDHKKNLYRIIVGTRGVQLAQQIDALDDQIRDANTDIRTRKDAASRTLPNGITFEDYLRWQPIEDIEVKIQHKSNEISSRQRAVERASEIQAKGLFVRIHLPSIPADFTTILAKQLADIASDAETRVKQQMARHQMDHQGESWLSQGLGYVQNNQCPFCGQDVQANDLIAAYRSHFNAAYKTLKQEVAQLGQRVKSAIGESSLLLVQQTLLGNLALDEFWKQFIKAILPDFSFAEIQQKYAKLCERCLALVQKKQENPTEPVTQDAEYSSALADVEALRETVLAYNATVDAYNTCINEQKTSVERREYLTTLKNELVRLEAYNRRFEPAVIQACQGYIDALNAKNRLERQKESTRQQLDTHCENILQTYEQSINDYLDQFNAGFRIANSRHLYTGGTPSCQYQIQINNTAIDLGDSNTSPGTPCFKTALSSGDRGALALAFFLAALNQDPQVTNKIVVLDDPFTSLDRFRRTCTQQLIRELAKVARQVIVLSHDPPFLKLIWDECPPDERKTLQLCRTGDNIMLGEWDIEAETQSTYLRDYSILLAFFRERTGTPLNVARAIRPFLEGMLRSHFPRRFEPNGWLGNFIKTIRAGTTDGLQHAQADLPELEAINEYSKKYHHEQNPNADAELISSDELHGYVKRTLRLVGGC